MPQGALRTESPAEEDGPIKPGHDGEGDVSPHSRGTIWARVMHHSRPSEARGRRECRVLAAPMARLQQKKQAAVTTGTPQQPAFPARCFDGVYVLSLVYRAF